MNFLVFCWAIGVHLAADGDSIRFDADASKVFGELVDVIRHHKAGLVYILGSLEDGTTTREEILRAYDIERSLRCLSK
ncbi:hypothetical protein SH467x_001244 [Pirellulaceae bacterium SH467]